MAANYTILGQYTTTAFLGGTRIVNVRQVSFQTHPSEIYAEYAADLSIFDPADIGGAIGVLATGIESVAGRGDIAGMQYEQDVNRAQQLSDFMIVTVMSTSGNSTEDAKWLIDVIFAVSEQVPEANYNLPGAPKENIATIKARLDATEAL